MYKQNMQFIYLKKNVFIYNLLIFFYNLTSFSNLKIVVHNNIDDK